MPLGVQPWDKLRLGRISSIDYDTGVCDIRFFDRVAGGRQGVVLNQPYIGRGWGILVGVEVGTLILVGEDKNGSLQIVSYLAHPQFFEEDIHKYTNIGDDEYPYRKPESGEIVIQSKSNSIIAISQVGDILFETPEGNYIELDREADLIAQQSAQRKIICDNGTTTAGVVRRDVRGLKERELDILFGGVSSFGLDFDTFTQTVGIDPTYLDAPSKGLFDPSFPVDKGRGSGANTSDMINPAITEWNMQVNEFSDGNPGVDDPILDDRAKRRGFVEPNVLAETSIGTLTNEIGRQIRFDYDFGAGDKGHGNIWWSTDLSQTSTRGGSNDHKFSRDNTLTDLTTTESTKRTAPGHNSDAEWTVDSLEQTPTAILMRTLLHTKGADNTGKKETEIVTAFRSGDEKEVTAALEDSFPGSLWEMQVDKEGLTKLNIPAATDIGGIEPFRAGRSLLMNLDGDATVSIGKQKATGEAGLDRITAGFINRNYYPEYGRKDRSLTLDLEGNVETHIGGDLNTNQSIMAQLDGSISLLVGKEHEAIDAGDAYDYPITTTAKTTERTDRSLTARLQGNAELHIGHDEIAQQSLIVETTGGNALHCGKDVDGQSLKVVAAGGLSIKIQGPMNSSNYALHLDAEGVLHIEASDNVELITKKECKITAEEDISIISNTGSIKLNAAENIEMTAKAAINMSAPNLGLNTNAGSSMQLLGDKMLMMNSTTALNTTVFNILGGVGITGYFLAQGVPGGEPAMPIARIGDMVQVGTNIGTIITGSKTSLSI